ncbi:hypothetical protein [Filimonas effusa]|uniref:Uncharacterized protein n=1 Tax=Filimonas effusa TaxID=2508721 RepID=A0A4Q1D775_9BACT|nr:hypothetical protein [Filimonas effusa]RXK83906.1 hypothetical protein ESB13_17705 [Filimonas effusa]
MTQKDVTNKDPKKEKDKDAIKPDPETLHTTDPQEHMEGPISSLVQSAKETMEEEDGDKKQEKDKKENKS